MKNVDPEPFVYHFPNGKTARAKNSPTTSRVGWRFEPRRGYSQNLDDYTEQQRKYA